MLQRCDMLACMFDGSASQSRGYITSLFDTFLTFQTTQDPLWINYCNSLLRLSLSDSQCQRRLWKRLLDAEHAEQAKITYLRYTCEINRRFALDFSELSPVLKDHAKTTPLLLFIWEDFLEFLFTHPELKTERDTFLEKVGMSKTKRKKIFKYHSHYQPQLLIQSFL